MSDLLPRFLAPAFQLLAVLFVLVQIVCILGGVFTNKIVFWACRAIVNFFATLLLTALFEHAMIGLLLHAKKSFPRHWEGQEIAGYNPDGSRVDASSKSSRKNRNKHKKIWTWGKQQEVQVQSPPPSVWLPSQQPGSILSPSHNKAKLGGETDAKGNACQEVKQEEESASSKNNKSMLGRSGSSSCRWRSPRATTTTNTTTTTTTPTTIIGDIMHVENPTTTTSAIPTENSNCSTAEMSRATTATTMTPNLTKHLSSNSLDKVLDFSVGMIQNSSSVKLSHHGTDQHTQHQQQLSCELLGSSESNSKTRNKIKRNQPGDNNEDADDREDNVEVVNAFKDMKSQGFSLHSPHPFHNNTPAESLVFVRENKVKNKISHVKINAVALANVRARRRKRKGKEIAALRKIVLCIVFGFVLGAFSSVFSFFLFLRWSGYDGDNDKEDVSSIYTGNSTFNPAEDAATYTNILGWYYLLWYSWTIKCNSEWLRVRRSGSRGRSTH
eukprot:jgi/Bigna1/89723/estExt_fgenesh1_pg.C_540080